MIRKVIYFLAIPCLSLLFSCGSSTNGISSDLVKNENSADGKVSDSSAAKFEFREETHNFGKLNQGEKVKYSFVFKNVGKSDLVIASASASCGCTIADYPKGPIHSGGEGTIDVSFNSEGKKGMQHKTITILANTNPNSKQLSIQAEVVEL